MTRQWTKKYLSLSFLNLVLLTDFLKNFPACTCFSVLNSWVVVQWISRKVLQKPTVMWLGRKTVVQFLHKVPVMKQALCELRFVCIQTLQKEKNKRIRFEICRFMELQLGSYFLRMRYECWRHKFATKKSQQFNYAQLTCEYRCERRVVTSNSRQIRFAFAFAWSMNRA